MEVPNSSQGHPLGGEQLMLPVDKILEELGFQPTTHDQCVCKRTDSEGTILILWQVDDFLVGTADEAAAKISIKRIGERINLITKRTCLSLSWDQWMITTG